MARNRRLWKLRQRFGIAAPRVAVRSEMPWYWRWLGVVLVLALAGSLAMLMYDAGRRFAGFDQREVNDELDEAKRELERLRTELTGLRAATNAADSRLSIERSAQQKLAQQLRGMEQENARLREELALLESMISSDSRNLQPLSIYRFKVEPDVLPGEYRYRLLLMTSTARRDREFQGRLELVVNLTEGGQSAIISFPEQEGSGAAAFRLAFKYFHRVEGTFRVSPRAKVENVQVRVYESGSKEPRATLTVTIG